MFRSDARFVIYSFLLNVSITLLRPTYRYPCPTFRGYSPSSPPSHTALMSHFLQPRSAPPHTAVVIVLKCKRPWTFLEELRTWLAWIERWVQASQATVHASSRSSTERIANFVCP